MLTTDRREASRGLFATAELLVEFDGDAALKAKAIGPVVTRTKTKTIKIWLRGAF